MVSQRSPRYGVVVACLAAAVAALLIAAVTPWVLWVVWVAPLALVIGICAWHGMTATEAWERMGAESGDDVGRGPAGWGP